MTRALSPGTLRARASVGNAWVRGGGAPAGLVDLGQRNVSGALWLARPLLRGELTLGASLDRHDHDYQWDATSDVPDLFGAEFPGRFATRQSLSLAAFTAQLAHPLGGWGRAELRTRGERALGQTIVLPSILVTTENSERWRLTLSASRRAQWTTQALEPREGAANPPRFVLDRPRTTAIAAAAIERRDVTPTREGTVSLTAFARRDTDRPVLQPPLPAADTGSFPDFVRRNARAVGMSVASRHTWSPGRALQAAYTRQRATLATEAGDQPADWDVPHAVTLFGAMPLGRGWTFTAVMQARSGAPITPVEARILVPSLFQPGVYTSRYILGAPNSGRVDPYRRLDLGVRRNWRAFGAEWAANANLLNTTSRQNPLAFGWYGYFCREAGRCGVASNARNGLPLLPSVGLEVRW
jgi:hypothetical protein